MTKSPAGTVFLVGAGPGDPGLLTVRGRELLERAGAVVYDHLVHESIPGLAPLRTDRIFVGKRPGHQPLTQDDINRLLISLASRHSVVVRLKGGDPFIFGRGGEEAVALAEAGVPFEIVPGVTAALGAAAYAGIPLTHRGLASSVTMLTGHATPDDGAVPALESLPLDGTLVFYMSAGRIAENLRAALDSGRDPHTPAAIIQSATLPNQRVVAGTLEVLAERAPTLGIESPALIVIGDTVELRDHLKWFEDRPLFGRKVVVTRAKERAGELVRLLRDRGAEVFEFPTVEISSVLTVPEEPFYDFGNLTWIVLTSINAIETMFARLAEQKRDARDLRGVRLCAISARTAEALRNFGLRPDLIPSKYESKAVADEMERAGGPLQNKHVLIPRPEIGRSTLPDVLRHRGAQVHEMHAYAARVPDGSSELVDELMKFAPDYVVFNSASAARNLREILGSKRTTQLAETAAFAAIGPIAAEAADEAHMPAKIVPPRHTVPDLVAALAAFDAKRKR